MKQALRDKIRVFNKHVTNKLLIHLCGRSFGHFAILTHTGRKSGRLYQIPIIAEPAPGGFVIALTYGRKVDWLHNVLAKGGCRLRWKNRDYELIRPELIELEAGAGAFPKLVRKLLKIAGTKELLGLDIAE